MTDPDQIRQLFSLFLFPLPAQLRIRQVHINNHGFTLIEVLISLILLSFILFGFDAMELYSLNSLRATYDFHIASNQLISMSERLHSIGSHTYSKEEDIWNEQNKQLLPKGIGTIVGQYPDYTVTIYWGSMSHPCPKIQLGQSGCIELRVTL